MVGIAIAIATAIAMIGTRPLPFLEPHDFVHYFIICAACENAQLMVLC